MRQLCEIYLDASDRGLILGKGGRPKRSSTIYTDRGRISRHILPLLGTRLVQDLHQSDIHRFIRDVASGRTAVVEKTDNLRGKAIVKGGAGTATRTAGLLGSLLSFAVSEGIIGLNPAVGVRRPADNRRSRRLSAEEYVRLGEALASLDVEGLTQGSAAVRLLALTGCRSGEIINLQRKEVDVHGRCLRLSDSKEGASVRPLGKAALDLIVNISPKLDYPFVLTPVRGGQRFGGLAGTWVKLMKKAGIDGATPHTLRHSFASVAADMGFTESTIAAMLGHQSSSVTSRYIHHLDTVLLAAADKVAAQIQDWFAAGERMSGATKI
jgi:integrase